MQLSFGKAASPYFNPVCRILFFSISYGKIGVFSAQQAKLLTKGFGMFFFLNFVNFFCGFSSSFNTKRLIGFLIIKMKGFPIKQLALFSTV